jgi:hypothetical protein
MLAPDICAEESISKIPREPIGTTTNPLRCADCERLTRWLTTMTYRTAILTTSIYNPLKLIVVFLAFAFLVH